ncbi:MAG: heme-copper oxidase subunit III, partial [Isosphaeraceae bacterium]
MAHAPAAAPPATATAEGSGHPASANHHHQAPLTPGKVAMWLFLATEIMFFTGLIGSYIVLRMGSPADAYSNFYPPGYLQTTGNELSRLSETQGVLLVSPGENHHAVSEILHHEAGVSEEDAHHLIDHTPVFVGKGMPQAEAAKVRDALNSAGAQADVEELKIYDWPLPYDHATNPLSIDLTAANTFVLICSSVTMVLALGAIQRGNKKKLTIYLLATTLIGATFLGVQVFEYYELMRGHHYPIGISRTGHFT